MDSLKNSKKISKIIKLETKEQSRRNRDYTLLKDIHYYFKDGNPDLYDFLTSSLLDEKNRTFSVLMIDDIKHFIEKITDKYLTFYNRSIEANKNSFIESLTSFATVLDRESDKSGEGWVTLFRDYEDDINLTDSNLEKYLHQLDDLRKDIVNKYDVFYFHAISVI